KLRTRASGKGQPYEGAKQKVERDRLHHPLSRPHGERPSVPGSSASGEEGCRRGENIIRATLTLVSVTRLREAEPVKQLIAYLLEHMILDFQGDLTLEMVRDFLRDDDSREGRALLAKLVEDRGVSDMMITLADCLQDFLRTGINEEVLR